MRAILPVAFISLLIALVACSPSEEAIRAAIEATAAAAPTATVEPTPEPSPTVEPSATPAPTAEPSAEPTVEPTPTDAPLTLEEIVTEAADTIPPPLLADFVRDAPTHIRQDTLGDLKAPIDYIMHELYSPEREGTGGAAIIYLYDNEDDARQAYGAAARQLDGMGYDLGVSKPDVGERATMEDLDGRILLAFARCNAFVLVWTTDARPFDVQAYATRIDELLRPLACGE